MAKVQTTPNKSRKVAFSFREGGPTTATVLGGKGAGLVELTQLGVPVPAGFTVTTSVARAFAQHGTTPKRLEHQLQWGLDRLERETGRKFGAADNPLLVSVRSGAAVSMPGMMDTVLNLGMNHDIVRGLAKTHGARTAWDCYRRFLSMYGEIVLGIQRSRFDNILASSKLFRGLANDQQLNAGVLQEICHSYRSLIKQATGKSVSDDPMEQLQQALLAVLKSWDNPRAKAYRKANGIPNDLGTAINIQSMVFGNRDNNSATGVVFSRNVATGQPGMWGEFLVNAQGEDVVAGSHTPQPIAAMHKWNKNLYNQLDAIVKTLEDNRKAVVDVEFTVEQGKLYILQVRNAKLSPEAAATIATHFVWEKKLSKAEAVAQVSKEQLEALRFRGFDPADLERAKKSSTLAQGIPASPGAAVGKVVLTSEAAVEAAKRGEKVILVRPDTSPDDLPGMLVAEAIVTATGGNTSHAAVVARGLGKPAVVSCYTGIIYAGDDISVDGNTGVVVKGTVKLAELAQKKEVNLFMRWAAFEQCPAPKLNFAMFEESVSYNDLLVDFYLTESMAQAATGTALSVETAKLKASVHANVAERLAMYLVVAVGGEIRHAKGSDYFHRCRDELNTLIKQFGIQLGGVRGDAQRKSLTYLKSVDVNTQIRFLQLTATVFEKGSWTRAMGGKNWANIANAALNFLSGKLSHTVFADHAFDLEHNNGTVFGKNKMLDGSRELVRYQLDAKKHAGNPTELIRALDKAYKRFLCWTYEGDSKAPPPSPEVLSLYEVGKKLGIW